MARLQDIYFRRENETGDIVDFKSSVTVTGDGIFRMSIPDYLMKDVDWRALNVRGVKQCPIAGQLRLAGRDLDTLKIVVDELIAAQLAVARSERLVILYRFSPGCHYAYNEAGDIEPNMENDSFKWNDVDGGMCRSVSAYTVGFSAEVVRERTCTKGDKASSTYDNLDDDEVPGGPARKLDRFPHICLRGTSSREPLKAGVQVLPYTEAAAQACLELMLGLCRLQHKLSMMFDRKGRLLLPALPTEPPESQRSADELDWDRSDAKENDDD